MFIIISQCSEHQSDILRHPHGSRTHTKIRQSRLTIKLIASGVQRATAGIQINFACGSLGINLKVFLILFSLVKTTIQG